MTEDTEPLEFGTEPALPTIEQIWSDRYRTQTWHRIWLTHLGLQGSELREYESVADAYLGNPNYADEYDLVVAGREGVTRHEVVAALDVYNAEAGQDTAHRGLASSDLVDVANQSRIADSLAVIIDHGLHVARQLRDQMVEYGGLKMVARTHGQPAELTTLGHRYATILAPLLDWLDRAVEQAASYPLRPPYGAVGTAADLKRVLDSRQGAGKASSTPPGATTSASDAGTGVETPPDQEGPVRHGAEQMVARLLETGGWGPVERYSADVAARLGFLPIMDATRQVYHRSYDLRIASLVAELASIAQTWATDRRIESMLGLGNETHLTEQSASSSMAQKTNPRFSERIVALCVVTRSHLQACSEMAGMEWLEGDVSTSAARRLILPALFSNIDAILANWLHVLEIWRPDLGAIEHEVLINRYRWATPAIMDLLIQQGVSRPTAHNLLRKVWAGVQVQPGRPEWTNGQFKKLLTTTLIDVGIKIGGGHISTREHLRGVTESLLEAPIGNISDQIDYLDRRTTASLDMATKTEWRPEIRP